MMEMDEETVKRLMPILEGIVHELGELKCAVNELRRELEIRRYVAPSPNPCGPLA